MKKQAIPDVPPGEEATRKLLQALKQNVEVISGRQRNAITKLATTATLADVVSKLNEVINQLQS